MLMLTFYRLNVETIILPQYRDLRNRNYLNFLGLFDNHLGW